MNMAIDTLHPDTGTTGKLCWMALMLATAVSAWAQPDEISLSTFSGGGGTSSDGFFEVEASIGQPVTRIATDGFYELEGGLWPSTAAAPPFIVLQPQDAIVDFASFHTLEIVATSSEPLRYQWRFNGIKIDGATNATYDITSFTLDDAGAYTVLVISDSATVLSDTAIIRAPVPILAPGDLFADRVLIEITNTVFRADNTGATLETNEPMHGAKLGGASVWYTWSTNTAGIATFRTRGSAFDTIIAVYTGKAVDGLNPIVSDDDRGGFFTSEVRFNVTAGTSYQIALDGLGGRQGPFTVAWEFEPTTEKIPELTAQPESQSVPLGGGTTLFATVTGTGLSYQWYFNDHLLSGETLSSLVLTNIQLGDIGHYYVAVTNADGRGEVTLAAALEIGPVPSAVSHPKLEDAYLAAAGGSAMLHLNSLLIEGFNVASLGNPQTQIFDSKQSNSSDNCAPCGEVGGQIKWVVLQAESDGFMTIDTMGSSNSTLLVVYDYTIDFDNLCSDYFVACDTNSALEEGTFSQVTFPTAEGSIYYVGLDVIDDMTDSSTNYLNWNVCPFSAPLVQEGASLLLTSVTNHFPYEPDPFYYWRTNGVDYASTDEPFLLLEPPPRAMNFSVSFMVSSNGNLYENDLDLGLVFSTLSVGLAGEGNNVTYQVLLQGLLDPEADAYRPFSVQRLEPVPLTNCACAMRWETYAGFATNHMGDDLLLDFPIEQPSALYRIRPPPPEINQP